MHLEVSILMVGYNSLAYLEDALASVPDAIEQANFEILFINNGNDGSEQFVAETFAHVQVQPSRGNIGFAAANNALAAAASGEWLLLLNPDTRLYPRAIKRLLEAARCEPDYDILAGVMLDAAGRPQGRARIEFPTLRRILRGLLPATVSQPVLHEDKVNSAEAVSGGYMMIRKRVWEALDGMDEGFFLYAEELDFCRRAQLSGSQIGIVSDSYIYHDVGSGSVHSPNRVLLKMKGSAHYYHKHFSPAYAAACVASHWLTNAVRWSLSAVLGLASKKYRAIEVAHRQVTLRPWLWVSGYSEGPR